MDLFLLPPASAHADESRTWASPAGARALIPLLALAGPKPKMARVFAFFPAQESQETEAVMIEALREIHATREAEVRVVAPVAAVREDLLEHLRQAGLVDIALSCSAEESAAAASAVQTAATFSGKHPATRFRWRLWLESSRSTNNLARLSLLQSAGLPFEAVDINALCPADPAELEEHESAPVQHFASMACSLYEGSLTINGQGDVILCPRIVRAPGATASLLGHTPQALLQRKGWQAALVGRAGACLTCRSRARFEWSSSNAQTLKDWMAEGKRQAEASFGAGIAPPPGPSSNEIEDLGSLTPEQQRDELEKFEAQLKVWSAGMGGWQDGQTRT